ncbi:hypothetical protein N431DRAFT_71222 [Stipitochalara longipes BDJ]|nr:hypothetical protein N431DRAFT_71222 [Stipitochalara longipes BDJ]
MSERALRLPGSYPDHDPEEFQNDPPQPRSRPTALHTPSSHRPASSRHRSSSNQPSIPHSRPGASRHESPRTQSSNGEDTPIIFVQEQSRPPPSHRTTSAPTASSRSNFIRSFRSMFTSKPMTEVPDSRVPTEHAPLVDNARTMADGFALPSHMQSVYHPTIARRSNSDPPIASRQSNLDPPSVARRSNHEPSAFPDSEHPSSRIQTEKAPLLDIERTHYEVRIAEPVPMAGPVRAVGLVRVDLPRIVHLVRMKDPVRMLKPLHDLTRPRDPESITDLVPTAIPSQMAYPACK